MAKKLTITEVRKRIEESSGSKLLSKEYIGAKSKLDLLCVCGEVFHVSIMNFNRGKTMCDKCSDRGTQWDYSSAKKYIEDKGCRLISDKYVNVDTDLTVKCKDCGDEYSVSLYAFNKHEKHTCNNCSYQRTANGQKLNYKYVKLQLERNGCTLLSETYNTCYDKLKLKCHCGNIFYNNYSEANARDKVQCSECGIKLRNIEVKNTYFDMKQYIEKESGCKMVSLICNDMRDDIDVMCGCGEIFTTTFFRFKHNNKRQCGKCSGRIMWSINSVKEYVESNSDCELISTTYTNSDENMEFKCECGNIFTTSFDKFKGRGKQFCNECSCRSRLENKSTEFFKANDVIYIPEKTFDDCINDKTGYQLRYDFYLPEYNTLIECDGIQHFEPIRFFNAITDEEAEIKFKDQQYKDNLKNEYATQNNINLVRIPYWELDNIDEVLTSIINNSKNLKECI